MQNKIIREVKPLNYERSYKYRYSDLIDTFEEKFVIDRNFV